LTQTSTSIKGSVLAPKASANMGWGNIWGQLFVKVSCERI
jgi:choice-of-anchor A domain-containing protein